MTIKIISLNIEGKWHLEKVSEWVKEEKAEVVCLMEVCEEDLVSIAGSEYPYITYAPNDILGNSRWERTSMIPVGVAILSKYKIEKVESIYCGRPPRIEIVPLGSSSHAPILLVGVISVGATKYKVGVVHFTWTKDGSESEEQRRDLATLMGKVAQEEMIMVGDFNFSRGGELYKQMSRQFVDNIPSRITTTIDPKLHYANLEQEGKLKLVVDYVWSTPTYVVSEVQVCSGLSDHCGLVANVGKI